jgi:hypothetical protein
MERGDLNQMSFAFTVIDEEWIEKKGELPIRIIKEVDPLYDVSIVTFPAYPTTDAKVRDIITKSGINYDELSGLMFRAKQGLPIQKSDLDLINASIDVLKGYIPKPSGIVPDVLKDEIPQRFNFIQGLELAKLEIELI